MSRMMVALPPFGSSPSQSSCGHGNRTTHTAAGVTVTQPSADSCWEDGIVSRSSRLLLVAALHIAVGYVLAACGPWMYPVRTWPAGRGHSRTPARWHRTQARASAGTHAGSWRRVFLCDVRGQPLRGTSADVVNAMEDHAEPGAVSHSAQAALEFHQIEVFCLSLLANLQGSGSVKSAPDRLLNFAQNADQVGRRRRPFRRVVVTARTGAALMIGWNRLAARRPPRRRRRQACGSALVVIPPTDRHGTRVMICMSARDVMVFEPPLYA